MKSVLVVISCTVKQCHVQLSARYCGEVDCAADHDNDSVGRYIKVVILVTMGMADSGGEER